ncbi:hypothetical protein KUL25_01475 [Rhodobacteraceae bacterium N5(2021)]|uniref:Uncharacterized protein n=1 Tax=Gymnodinialimonas phycosphaerae TaxID=2841589 RepID=A0A975YGC7_9RHOB|nr:hypothetical protein [Gymnodinialimonas phycosphaerae]MBY4891429.1 hypothetical protein [Gymnodinialimonas phycosphaerae]
MAPGASAARAPTPATVTRPACARRWVVPAGLLGAAAVAVGAIFGLPALQSGRQVPATVETAALAPLVALPPALPPAAPTPAATAPMRSLVPAPGADDAADAIGASALAAGLIDTATPPALIPDKLAIQGAATGAPAVSGATIQFGTPGTATSAGTGTVQAPGAIGIGELTPQREGSSAPDAAQDPQQPVLAPQSQRTPRPDDGGLRDGG